MIGRFLISGEVPAKKNSKQIFFNKKTGKPFITGSERYKEWHKGAELEMQYQLHFSELPLIDFPISIKLEFHHSDNRKRDSDNGVSTVFDLLKDVGIIVDDCWQIIQDFSVVNVKETKENGSFCVITIDKYN